MWFVSGRLLQQNSEPLDVLITVEVPQVLKNGLLLLVATLAAPTVLSAQDAEAELLSLHREFVMSQMMDRDPSFLLANSVESYTVVAPGGVIETRDQVIRGLRAFAQLDSVSLTREHVVINGDIALVLAGQEVHGEVLGPAAGFGRVTTSTVFARGDDGAWLAISRSITPCHPRAVEAGRC